MDSETSYDYVFKIIFLGEAGVGKTSILNRHFKREFEEKLNSTIGVIFYKKIYEKNIKICFQYWDTAGQERYKSLIHAYLVKADVIVFVYDITEKNSFSKINFWMELVKQSNDDFISFIIGNKMDLDNKRKVSIDQGEEISKKYNCVFIEVSAKSGMNIKELFEMIQKSLYTRTYLDKHKPKDRISLGNKNSETDQNFYLCCL